MRVDRDEKLSDIGFAAGLECRPDSVEHRLRQSRTLIEPRIGPAVARHDGERETIFARGGEKLFHAIAPIIEAAQEPHENEARLGGDLLEIKIDRIGMLQHGERGKARVERDALLKRARDDAEIAVGKGKENEVCRRLREIDGAFALVDRSCRGAQQMHGLMPRRGRIAARSRPASPITTNLPIRSSSARQGRSNCWRKRAPTPCTRSRIGLPLTGRKPFMRRTSCVSASAISRSTKRAGSSIGATSTTKLAKSS